jgi:hypothetical protein
VIGPTREGIQTTRRVAKELALSFDHFHDLTCIPCHPIIPPSHQDPRHHTKQIQLELRFVFPLQAAALA